jgi:APA family basic amino acid/polyamine antiporter
MGQVSRSATGWLQLLATFPGSLAAMAVGTATFQLPVLLGEFVREPVDLWVCTIDGPTFWAVGIVVVLTALNHIGVVLSGAVQLVLTMVPLAVLLVVSLFVVGDVGTVEVGAGHDLELWPVPAAAALAAAYLPVYFAYSGWNAAIYIGGEIREPGRNLPRGHRRDAGGARAVHGAERRVPHGVRRGTTWRTSARRGRRRRGAVRATSGVVVVTVMILLAMLGSINGTVMTGSRIAYAMASRATSRGGRAAARPLRHAGVALWAQAALAIGLITFQGFERLMRYASCAMLISGSLTVYSVVRLRRRMPEHRGRTGRLLSVGAAALRRLERVRAGGAGRHQDVSVFMAAGWFALAGSPRSPDRTTARAGRRPRRP